ncbi:hypothetical protein OA430_00915 [Candidatus Pelagibacter sp.]|nr:hypothetical protein [Candidatus Pelagibacter sp.]
MPHKNIQFNSLLAIKTYCENLPNNIKNKTDLELLDIAKENNSQSQYAKTLIINRYLPKVLKDSARIFNGQNSNPWHREDIIQTGIKGIINGINSFDKNKGAFKDKSGAFTKTICLNISKYLNKKKTNYDPLLSVEKGAEFKKVFYNYYKKIKKIRKKLNLNISTKIADSILIKEFGCKIDTLKEVQFIHRGIDNENHITESNFDDRDLWSFVDFAAAEGIIDPTVKQPQNLEDYYIEKNTQRNINEYKQILTQKEWELLDLLNNGNNKSSIQNNLNISKQRFSFLVKSISQKVQQHDGYRLPK